MSTAEAPAREKRHTIGAVCDRLKAEFPDISISKIRYLEDQGLLTPKRTQGGYRLFGEDDVERLETILRLQRDEFLPLRVIRQELASPATKERRLEPNAWLKALVPLELYPQGDWDPTEEYWGEPGEPIEAWAKPIIRRGVRPMYEMEQVLPGADPEDFDSDPILEANELKDRRQITRAKKLLESLLVKDVRCLDAHAHLGNLAFDKQVRTALEHYQRGVLIGELSLGEKFEGVLPWGMIDNRPFLRCLNGLGLCLWRLERFEEAEALFMRLLWMSPSDNLGVRFLLPSVRTRKPWTANG